MSLITEETLDRHLWQLTQKKTAGRQVCEWDLRHQLREAQRRPLLQLFSVSCSLVSLKHRLTKAEDDTADRALPQHSRKTWG